MTVIEQMIRWSFEKELLILGVKNHLFSSFGKIQEVPTWKREERVSVAQKTQHLYHS